MKRLYRRHPEDYAIGENEKWYGDMAAKGWRLVNRGLYFSKFEPCEPVKLRYRIEISVPGFLEENGELPDDQIAVYEDCGWQYVTQKGMVYIFCTGRSESEAPEFYEEPEQQAKTLKRLKRNSITGFFWLLILLSFYFFLGVAAQGGWPQAMDEFGMDIRKTTVEHTAMILLCVVVLTDGLYAAIHQMIYVNLLYYRLKRGIPLNHEPQKRYQIHRFVSRVFSVGALICLLLIVVQTVQYRKYDMPAESEGDYVMMSELGVTGERGYILRSDNTSRVERHRSLSGNWIETYECIVNHDVEWLYQNIYQLRNEKQAEELAKALQHTAVFAKVSGGFSAYRGGGT